MTAVLAGLSLGLSLIIAIGAQNLFVLRQGMRREHVFLVATICAVSDLVLIAAGVAGLGAITTSQPWLLTAVRWAGAAFLVAYGVMAARRALWPTVVEKAEVEPPMVAMAVSGTLATPAGGTGHDGGVPADRSPAIGSVVAPGGTAMSVALTCLALTWLNPHVYLDTVFLLGSVAATHGEQRWLFAAGAMVGSLVWFYSLAFGARFLGRWLTTPLAERLLDAFVAVVMIVLGASLLLAG